MANTTDLLGQEFTWLRVVSFAGTRFSGGKMRSFWRCECKCGKKIEVVRDGLTTGHTKSCGCYKSVKCKESAVEAGKLTKTHGERYNPTPEYIAWKGMKARCHNPKHPTYERHGARGITVCQRWRESYKAFLADMGRKPTSAHTLDRIDNDGNYEPGNCRWATMKEQMRNMKSNRWIAIDGERKILADWLRHYGIAHRTFYNRVNRTGWSIKKALTTPVDKRYASRKRGS